MSHRCPTCSRVNPADAGFCYFDGIPLDGTAHATGPIAVGSRFFANPFVFPSGRTCRTFDELAVACSQDPTATVELLRQGFFGSFFLGLARADLARAAELARHTDDRELAFDGLLAALPTTFSVEPNLRVDPMHVNLGTLAWGENRSFQLQLENQGMRVIYGNLSAENTPWIAFGDGPGARRKVFQFLHDLTLTVRIVGTKLRASPKPLQGQLLLESNAGLPRILHVVVAVPVRAFPGDNVLAGALSPRQVAERARAAPREAAPLFTNGEVARWYASNGWTYPIQGPIAPGLGAIQQYFEVLGLTPPPRVQLSEQTISLRGNPQQQLRHELEVSSTERRPIYAHAVSDQPWLHIGRPRQNGSGVKFTLRVPIVPDRPGATLTANIGVRANGNQQFTIPLNLTIDPAPPPAPIVRISSVPGRPMESASGEPVSKRGKAPAWLHALPALFLILGLLGVLIADFRQPQQAPPPVSDEWSLQGLLEQIRGRQRLLGLDFSEEERFGLAMLDVALPGSPQVKKKLTRDPQGDSNNTMVRIDGTEYYFGRVRPFSQWETAQRQVLVPERAFERTMRFSQFDVTVRQQVLLLPGSADALDTCVVVYALHNAGEKPRTIDLRLMLDTFIGANDGVPFSVPGMSGFLDRKDVFEGDRVPEFVEAVENPTNPTDPGTVARMTLRGIRLPGLDLEAVRRLVICRHPGNPQQGWEWPYEPMDAEASPDSCAVLYWGEETLAPRATRYLGFAYGLGVLAKDNRGLVVSLPPTAQLDRELVVTGYVLNPRSGQRVALEIPDGLELVSPAEQTIAEAGERVAMYWKVRARRTGTFDQIRLRSGDQFSPPARLIVRQRSLFG